MPLVKLYSAKFFDKLGNEDRVTLSIGFLVNCNAMHAFAKGVVSLSIIPLLCYGKISRSWKTGQEQQKEMAEWFPTKERAFASRDYSNSGAAIGGIQFCFLSSVYYLSISTGNIFSYW